MTATRGRAPSREQLLFLLHEAAEIEHNLMCCYFYAAFSLKRADPHWSAAQAALVAGWRSSIHDVAFEEMSHLCLVGNLMTAIGGAANFRRPPFPIEAGPYPSDFVIRLQPFSPETVGHFQFLERPQGSDLPDAPGFEAGRAYRRDAREGRLSPGARDYDTVGDLYVTLREGFDAFAAEHGERALFIGDPLRQVDAELAPLPGVATIHDLASAHRAIDTIVTQGEGAGDEHHESHFSRFIRVGEELQASQAADPAFEPAWPAATNPVMNPPPTPDGKVHIEHPQQAGWLDIGNALYTTALRCLVQGFGSADRAAKSVWLTVSFALMKAIVPVGQGLAARPARADGEGPNAGLTFTSLRTLGWLPEPSAAIVVADRLGELIARAQALPLQPVGGETETTWGDMLASLDRQQGRLRTLAGADTSAPR